MTLRQLSLAALALYAGLLAGCSHDATQPEPPPTATITAGVLVEGGEGVLTGEHLDQLPSSLSVDEITVSITARTASELHFMMPPARGCEVDGRPVRIRLGVVTYVGSLHARDVLRLDVGESRILTREAMQRCLQLPADSERFVVTALNPVLDAAPSAEALVTLHAWTAAPGSLQAATIPAYPTRAPDADRIRADHVAWAAATPLVYSNHPMPFDARYATAQAGDTLPWVDWWGSRYPDCGGPRNRLPTINIVVAAVSSAGHVVIAVDTRTAHAAEWATPAVRARIQRAADIADRWVVPAVREVMDRDYVPLAGASGRWFHVFRPDVHGWSIDNNDAPQTACAYSSEVPSTVGPDLPPQSDAQAEYLAGLMIHEYGHHAEGVYRIRRWGAVTPPMRTSTGWPTIGEAWAQTVQETAARLASGQTNAARYGPIEAAGSGVPFPDFYLNGHGEGAAQSLWDVTEVGRGGYYDEGTRFLMFLRERWGDAAIGSGGQRFFGRVQELPHYDVPSLAGLVGLSASDALDQWSLADATDDLVDPSAAAAHGLPQLTSWVPRDDGPLPSLMVPRTSSSARVLRAGRGNYAAAYLFSDGADAGKGISLTFDTARAEPFVARITRLR